jgi:hypothetical protein
MRPWKTGLAALVLAGMCVPSSVFLAGPDATATRHCLIRGDRPDPVCTPGALNPDVTQSTVRSTICVAGWTATVRPPTSYTSRLKVQQIIEYGYADTDPAHYEEDHLVPLGLGGAPRDRRNLWPEPGASPNHKDDDERRLQRDVCAGKLTLATARAKLLARWGPPAQ